MPEAALLEGTRVVLGVTGGIAAYKAADLTSRLVQMGASVQVVLTEGARQFVGAMTFEALTRNSVYTSVFDGWSGEQSGHVTLAKDTDVVVVAPATASRIAAMAHGMANDMLGAVLLATNAPVIVAPAMEHAMWNHPATIANVATLRKRGAMIIGPESGHLASGAEGDGRLAAIDTIIAAIRAQRGRSGRLAGRHVLVTAGGTYEAIDPVRFIGNRSSGRMGVAIAERARDDGAQVTIIAGPTVTAIPPGLETIRVESAREMQRAVNKAVPKADVLVMAAAVADFRPEVESRSKLKKLPGLETMTLEMVRNPDIIAGVSGRDVLKVGFAAETDDLLHNAQDKLNAKDLEMIVANDATATIGSDQVEATLLYRDGRDRLDLPAMSKQAFAARLIIEIASLLETDAP